MAIIRAYKKQIIKHNENLLNEVPKIIHLYWDKSPMSWLQTLTVSTFHKQNPDWIINIYLPKQDYNGNIKYIPKYNDQDYFPLLEQMDFVNMIEVDLADYKINENLHNILRSDILRYHLLYEHGGIWSDFDVLWLKPINQMNHINLINRSNKQFGFSACLYSGFRGHYSIGVLITSKNHKFYQTLINKINSINRSPDQHKQFFDRKKNTYKHQAFGVELWKILYPDLQSLITNFHDCIGIYYKTFYPYSIFNLDELYNKDNTSVLDKDVICVHWFNGHELSKKYINEKQYDKKCSMTSILNKFI